MRPRKRALWYGGPESGQKKFVVPRSRTQAENEYTADEVEFLMALDRYKRHRHRPYPTWPEVLAIAKSLGYRRIAA